MLLQSDGNTVNIMPAYPEKCGDACFRLAVKGGAVADVCVGNSHPKDVKISNDGKNVTTDYNILFRGSRI